MLLLYAYFLLFIVNLSVSCLHSLIASVTSSKMKEENGFFFPSSSSFVVEEYVKINNLF